MVVLPSCMTRPTAKSQGQGQITRLLSVTHRTPPQVGHLLGSSRISSRYLRSRAQVLGLCVIRRFPDSAPKFLEPFSLVFSMNDAADEPQRFGNIVAVEPDVLTGRL